MRLNNQQKKQIQALMSDPRWKAIEQSVEMYLIEKFIEDSQKRESEFETIWSLASADGGKYHLQHYFTELEEAAHSVL